MVEEALLRRLRRFARFSPAEENILRQLGEMRTRSYEAHEDLRHEGDRAASVILFVSGWGCRYKSLEDGRRQITGLLLPGDLCDLGALVLGRSDHAIGAITPVRVAEIPRAELDQLIGEHARLARAFARDVAISSAIDREQLVSLGQRGALERLAHLFCELYVRLSGVGLAEENSFAFPITQTELGELAGISSVHVNRTLQELRSGGLIVLQGGVLTINDFESLAQTAMFDPAYLHLDIDEWPLDRTA